MVAAVVLIRAVPGDIPALARRIAGIEGVAEVYSVSGEYDLVAIVRVPEYERVARGGHGGDRQDLRHRAHLHAHRLPGLLASRTWSGPGTCSSSG